MHLHTQYPLLLNRYCSQFRQVEWVSISPKSRAFLHFFYQLHPWRHPVCRVVFLPWGTTAGPWCTTCRSGSVSFQTRLDLPMKNLPSEAAPQYRQTEWSAGLNMIIFGMQICKCHCCDQQKHLETLFYITSTFQMEFLVDLKRTVLRLSGKVYDGLCVTSCTTNCNYGIIWQIKTIPTRISVVYNL